MDPNAALAGIREIVAKSYRETGATLHDSSRLYDLTESLDAWLTKGGFLPEAWAAAAPSVGELSPNDHLLTRAGTDLDCAGLPYVLGTSLVLYPETPIFVRVHKKADRATIQFGHVNACVAMYVEAPQVGRLATLFAHTRDRLT